MRLITEAGSKVSISTPPKSKARGPTVGGNAGQVIVGHRTPAVFRTFYATTLLELGVLSSANQIRVMLNVKIQRGRI